MAPKLKDKLCNVLLEKTKDGGFWLHFEFIDEGMIVDEPVEIDDTNGDDEFSSNIDICNVFWLIKHIKWTILLADLPIGLENPRMILLEECNKLKYKDKKKSTS